MSKSLAVIDATTGTVLAPDNLYAVLATEKQLDYASNSDCAAFDLAKQKGNRIPAELIALWTEKKKFKNADIYAIAGLFGFTVSRDNDGQLVLYTGVR